jgi:hypothetical protein
LEEEDAGRGPASAQRSLCRFLFSSSSVALLVFLTTPKVTLPPTPSAHNYWSTPTSEQQEDEDGAELGLGLGLGQGQAVRLRVQHAVGRRQRTRSMHDSTRGDRISSPKTTSHVDHAGTATRPPGTYVSKSKSTIKMKKQQQRPPSS